jgi:hypothetical protein
MSKYNEVNAAITESIKKQHALEEECRAFFQRFAMGWVKYAEWPSDKVKFAALTANRHFERLKAIQPTASQGPGACAHWENGHMRTALGIFANSAYCLYQLLVRKEGSVFVAFLGETTESRFASGSEQEFQPIYDTFFKDLLAYTPTDDEPERKIGFHSLMKSPNPQ